MHPSHNQQNNQLCTLVTRIEFRANAKRASRRAFFRQMVTHMRTLNLITVHSRNWCVHTAIRPDEFSTQRLDLARWLVQQPVVYRFMLSEPIAIDALMRGEPTWNDGDVDWHVAPRDVAPSNAAALLAKLAQHSLIRGVQTLGSPVELKASPTLEELIARLTLAEEDDVAIDQASPPPRTCQKAEGTNPNQSDPVHTQPPPPQKQANRKKACETERSVHKGLKQPTVCLFTLKQSKALNQHQRKILMARMRKDLAREGIALVSFKGLCLATSTIGLAGEAVEQEVLDWTLKSCLISQLNLTLQTSFYGLFTSRLVIEPNPARSSTDRAVLAEWIHKLSVMAWILAWKVLRNRHTHEGTFNQVLDSLRRYKIAKSVRNPKSPTSRPDDLSGNGPNTSKSTEEGDA